MKKYLAGIFSLLFGLSVIAQTNIRLDALTPKTTRPLSTETFVLNGATGTQQVPAGMVIPVVDLDMVAVYGIVAGGFDNVLALMQFQSDWQGYKGHINAYMPEGDVCYSNNRFGYNIYDVDWKCKGGQSRFRPIYSGSDEKFQRVYNNGEIWQTNTLAYVGTQLFTAQYKTFKRALAGDTVIILTTASDTNLYRQGIRVLLQAHDQIGNGFPPGTRYNQWTYIKSNTAGSGKLILGNPLEYDFKDNLWDVPNILGTGKGSGLSRITALDRVDYTYPKHLGFYNITFGFPVGGAAGASGTFQPVADEVIVRNCYFEGHFWPTECRIMDIEGGGVIAGSAYSSEFDKVAGSVTVRNFFFNNVVSNATGIKTVYFQNVSFMESVQMCPEYLTFDHCSFRANAYPDNTAGALDGAPAATPIILLKIINGCTFSRTAGNASDYAMGIAALKNIIIPSVTGTTIIVPYSSFTDANTALKVYSMTKGTMLYKSDGSKIGNVDSTYWDQTQNGGVGAFMIAGDWVAPTAGETWYWSPVLNVFDDGSNKIVSPFSTGFAKYSDEMALRASKETTGDRLTLKLNLDGFRVDGSDRGFNFGQWLTRIEVNVSKVYSGTDSRCYLSITDTSYNNIAQIDLTTRGQRVITKFGVQGKRGFDTIDSSYCDKFHRQFRVYLRGSSGNLSDQTKSKLPAFEVIINGFKQ